MQPLLAVVITESDAWLPVLAIVLIVFGAFRVPAVIRALREGMDRLD